jgi:hypothetical protein
MTTRKRVVDVPPRRRIALESIRVVVLHDDEPDPSYLDDDEDRRAEYERGDFSFVGVRAEAEVAVDGVTQTLTSGGHWGIESDSKEYLQEVAEEEYTDLRQILKTIGVATADVPAGFDPAIIKWRA